MILIFQSGPNITRVNIEGKKISISSQKTGFRFVPINPLLNKEELEELNQAKNEEELIKIIEKDLLNVGYKLMTKIG